MEPWAVHFSLCFCPNLDSILSSFGVRFGLVFGLFWWPFERPNQVKLGPKCVLNHYLFKCDGFHADLFLCFDPFLTDRSKMGPKAIKGGAFFVLNFESFWGPFGEPKSAQDPADHWPGAIWVSIL